MYLPLQRKVGGEDSALKLGADLVRFAFEEHGLAGVVTNGFYVAEKRPRGKHHRVDAGDHRLGEIDETLVKFLGHVGLLDGDTEQVAFVSVHQAVDVFQQSQHVGAKVRDQRARIKLHFDGSPELVLAAFDGGFLGEKGVEIRAGTFLQVNADRAAENQPRLGDFV